MRSCSRFSFVTPAFQTLPGLFALSSASPSALFQDRVC